MTLGRSLLLLWVVAVLLALVGLGNLPLRDWDEAIAARVALELSQAPWPGTLLPTSWGHPYLNKPPGLHLLMAACIALWRNVSGSGVAALPPEAVVRLAPALLSTLVVPLGGLIQRELRPNDRLSAASTALILLTLLPVARHGRLAMLDGTQLSAMALLWWCLLRVRNADERPLLPACGAGLACSALLLLKAPILLPALSAGLVALLLDPERPAGRWGPLALGLSLGLLPGIGWHGYHLAMRGTDALHLWLGDGAKRVLLDAGEGSQLGWRVPLFKMLEGGWPWLPLWPFGLALAWRQRGSAQGRWPLILQVVMAASILPLRTQLPWYSHPLWLPLALLCAPVLAWLIRAPMAAGQRPPLARVLRRLPLLWCLLGGLLLVAGLLATTVPAPLGLAPYQPFLLSAGSGWLLGGIALQAPSGRQRLLGACGLAAGNLLALALLFQSPLWNWELAETWPVRPVAEMVQRHQANPVRLWQQESRPSLSWYAGQPITMLGPSDLAQAPPGWVLRREPLPANPWHCVSRDRAAGWTLQECR